MSFFVLDKFSIVAEYEHYEWNYLDLADEIYLSDKDIVYEEVGL